MPTLVLPQLVAAGLVLASIQGCPESAPSDTDTADVSQDVLVEQDATPDGATSETTPDSAAPDAGKSDLVGFDGQVVGPGGLGDACFSNEDCNSGYCIEGPNGQICTQTCLETCPDGYACKSVAATAPDVVFICVPNVLDYCGPCIADAQCFGGICLDDGTNDPYCTAKCNADNPCPDGFSCDTTTDANGVAQDTCVPTSGSCGCSSGSTGAVRPCQTTNQFGTCQGFETCNGNEWSACSAPTPAAELCDYQDNDCDGDIDEGFLNDAGQYDQFGHCGVCGQSCDGAIANANTSCDSETYDPPQCVVDSCGPGFFQLNAFYCGPVPAKLCSPCADDSNCVVAGAKCSQLSDGTYCTVPCATSDECPGGYSCEELGGSLQCVPNSGTCACDAGSVGLQRACENTYQDPQNPQAPLVTCVGLETCEAQGWTQCALGEDICDYSDNDCDGVIDNDWVDDDGFYFRDENCGVCGNNCLAADPPPNAGSVCDVSGTVPTCAIVCNPDTADVNGNPVDGCECAIDGTADVPDGVDHDCDGVDGAIDAAIFVAKNGDDSNSGTIDAPLRTIQGGIDAAAAGGKAFVFVATGVYSESIAVAEGVMVYGGYSGDFRNRDVALYQTAIFGQAPTPELPGAVNAIGLDADNGPTSGVAGLTVFGYINKLPGGSSYAVYIRDCGDQLLISDNVISAGSGGAGSSGDSGTSGIGGASGATGLGVVDLGATVCTTASHRAGGAGGTNACGGADVSGGNGGTSVCPDFNESQGTSACPVSAEQVSTVEETGTAGQGGGAGGEAGGDSYLNALDGPYSNCVSNEANCTVCKIPSGKNATGAAGEPGAPGASGGAGDGCVSSTGEVVGGLWVAGSGTAGAPGDNGTGGGGGGAGGGVETVNCDAIAGGTDLGGSGGGGGSGGCGGTGGAGGTGGGASFGLFVTWTGAASSAPDVSDNTIIRGDGGAGGAGGTGGAGGAGASGGAGGAAATSNQDTFCAPAGGSGGDGGDGGAGAGGGGGCGGASFGIYVDGGAAEPAWKSVNTFTADGSSGPGGAGGLSLGAPGQAGVGGAQGDTNF